MAQHLQLVPEGQYPAFSLTESSPGSPVSLGMLRPERPAEAGVQAFGQYAAMPAHSTGTREVAGDLHSFTISHGHRGFMQTQGQPQVHLMMNQFMFPEPWAEPWNPLRANAGPIRSDLGSQHGAVPLGRGLPNFMSFRGDAPPSEVDTVSRSGAGFPSDSGYESMPRQSLGNRSVYGGDVDQGAETESLISRSHRGLPQGSISADESRLSRNQKASPSPNLNTQNCPTCGATVKTKSEMKKHEARHSKPWKCNFPGCSKATEGFSTNNDLERHKRCVHKLRKADEVVYRCNVDQCKDKPKDWPRQDNFKQHLKRKHNLEGVDLHQFIYRSSTATDLAGLGGSLVIAPGNARVVDSDLTSLLSWSGSDQGPAAPSNAITEDAEDPGFDQTGNMIRFSRHAPVMSERQFATANESQCQRQARDPLGNVPFRLDMEPVLSGLSISPPIPQGPSATSPEASPPTDQLSYIEPAVLSNTRVEITCLEPRDILVAPREAMRGPEVDLISEISQDDGRLEQHEAVTSTPDEMAVDEPSPASISEDDQDMGGVGDEGPSDNLDDTQAKLSSDCDTEYSSGNEIHTKLLTAEEQSGTERLKPMDVDDETKASAFVQCLMEKGMLEKILQKVGYRKPEETETKDEKLPAVSDDATENGRTIQCQVCRKTFQRPCELKKHQKRHEKPYACTFAKCDKRFGSKNDWKRHENSQHLQLEIWRCAEKAADRPGGECGKVCHRRESLKTHLEKDHDIGDEAVVDKKLADCRMGRNFESRFWCGFCQKTIEPTGKGGPAHSERFDHIDNHFNGRNDMPKADIRDWKHVDTDAIDSPGSRAKGDKRERSSGWAPLIDAQAPESRKRGHGSDQDAAGAPMAKRRKKVYFWTCCVCKNYSCMVTSKKCMEPCNHSYCSNCSPFTEQPQDSDDEGLMT